MFADGLWLQMGASLPVLRREGDEVVVAVPTARGLDELRVAPPPGTRVGFLPFTRRNLFERVLAWSGHPYGWGERDGGQDCSRLLLDAFAAFGLQLGRHSGEQALAGARVVELGGLDESARTAALTQAMRDGAVLAFMPGHIMLMLGEHDGRAWAVSAISEFLEPCPGGGERTVRVDRVLVSDLELGRGTSKTAFIQRLERLAVFGR
jgi:hypothetical protein